MRLIFAFILISFLQPAENHALPRPSRKGGFLFPIKPGQPASLTGNMGEIRSNHFHGGLDIRTGWASGLPVLAAKDGHVSRVVMAGEGYGNTIFLTHPDGFVTVYAHLEKLSEPLHSAVKKVQYARKSFEVDVTFPPARFSFRQGEVLAISGNTGSSRGPHLHFEIRDTSGMVYNPLSFGFEEVKDNLSPLLDRLAVVPLTSDARVEGRFARQEISVREAGKEYHATRRIEVSGTIGLEMKARDRINNGTSNGGIFCTEIFRDGKLLFYHNLSQFPFNKSNHVNHLINYRNYRLTSEKFQKLYCPDGYFQTRHTPTAQHGKIRLEPGEKADLEIILWDVHGNKRVCRLNLVGKAAPPLPAPLGRAASRIQHEVLDNHLLLKCNGDPAQGNLLDLFIKGKKNSLSPICRENDQLIFLHDLRKGLPDSAVAGLRCKKAFSFAGIFYPGQTQSVSLPGLGLTIRENSLFDTLFLEAERDEKGVCRLNTSLTPLAEPLTLSLPPLAFCPEEKQVACAEALSGIFSKALPVENRNGNIYFTSKYLGRFCLQADSAPPVIKPGRVDASQARFDVFDRLSGIQSFEASINGEWILMVYDKKRNLLYSEPWPSQLPMRGDFLLKVTDKAGNVATYLRKI